VIVVGGNHAGLARSITLVDEQIGACVGISVLRTSGALVPFHVDSGQGHVVKHPDLLGCAENGMTVSSWVVAHEVVPRDIVHGHSDKDESDRQQGVHGVQSVSEDLDQSSHLTGSSVVGCSLGCGVSGRRHSSAS
jgi:hypothetical protein